MAVSGADIKRLRERRGWTQSQLGEAINVALARNAGSSEVSRWEKGKRAIPPEVGAFLETLMLDAALPPLPDEDAGGGDDAADYSGEPGDLPPGPGPAEPQPALGPTGGSWARACTELWELIATGVGMAGAAVGSELVVMDGAIIAADAPALGAAWARLAETNETFRKMLLSMTEGGAWLQVALVTGTTVSKCYQNHATAALQPAGGGDNGAAAVAPAAA